MPTSTKTADDLDDLKAKDEIILIQYHTILKLQDKLDWLEALNTAGVDNWDGINEAYEIYKQMKGN